jgi:hypothetical protein
MFRIGSRRRFTLRVGGLAATAALANRSSYGQSSQPQTPPKRRSSPLPDELVHECSGRAASVVENVRTRSTSQWKTGRRLSGRNRTRS